MGNHNVKITNPKGEWRYHFAEPVTLYVAKDFLTKYGPAPIGWQYQVVNLNKKRRKYADYIVITGFDTQGDFVDQRKARVQTSNGWYTPRMAIRDMRALGASWFCREKVYTQEVSQEYSHEVASEANSEDSRKEAV